MTFHDARLQHPLRITWPIVIIGAMLGCFMAWSVLAGDQQGRVNLFYLLLVYLFIPLGSLLLSSLSLLYGKGINLARLMVAIPIWSHQKRMLLQKTQQLKVDKFWLFFQSHLAALAFSVSSLSVFFFLLTVTDVNFVWRSTLLNATDLLPLLQAIARPWQFWPEAQPTLALLQATQDSRLEHLLVGNSSYADWWRFIFAVQLFYCLFLRSALLIITAIVVKFKIRHDLEPRLSSEYDDRLINGADIEEYAPLTDNLPSEIMLNNWSNMDLTLLEGIKGVSLSEDKLMNAGPLASDSERRVAERWQGEQIILVKAWEPPLGELADFMQNGRGIVWPVDWQDSHLVPLQLHHLQEWRRFVYHLTNWKVFVPPAYIPREVIPEDVASSIAPGEIE